MATTENFDSDLGIFTGNEGATWDAAGGYAGGGAKFDNTYPAAGGYIDVNPAAALDAFSPGVSFYYRADIVSLSEIEGLIRVSVNIDGEGEVLNELIPAPAETGDSGWLYYSADLSAYVPGTLSYFRIDTLDEFYGQGTIYVDYVGVGVVNPNELESGGGDEVRLLGIDTDGTALYVTAVVAGVLTMYRYSATTLILQATLEFGAADYDDPGNLAKGIYPVVKPGADGHLYLRGRDGDDIKVQLSDDYGDTWTSLDDALWGSTKFCIALLLNPLNPADLLAVFADDDIWQSLDAGDNWTKIDDAPGTLRRAARHPIDQYEVLLAAQAEDNIWFSNNLGKTTQLVSDSALDTINAIEVSL